MDLISKIFGTVKVGLTDIISKNCDVCIMSRFLKLRLSKNIKSDLKESSTYEAAFVESIC